MATKTAKQDKKQSGKGSSSGARKALPKKAVKPPAANTAAPAKKTPPAKPASSPALKKGAGAPPARRVAMDKKELETFRGMLWRLRERITGQITSLADDSLKYVDDASSEDRTDDFDREFALNLVSSEHDAIFEIDEALRRIAEGTYGICDTCNCLIERTRLRALPFAKLCVRCQSETERGRSRFRPFGDTLVQGAERGAEGAEAEETE